MVLGAIGTIGLVVSMFMSWRTTDVHPSDIPFAFLFDHGTTARARIGGGKETTQQHHRCVQRTVFG